MWIEYENEIYNIGHMYDIRYIPMLHLLGNPQYAIEDPAHLEINDDNYQEFSSQLKVFNPSTYYKNASQHIIKCITKQ